MAADKMPPANFGPKYEQHVQQLQKLLEESNKRVEELTKQDTQLKGARDAATEEVADLRERLKVEEEAKVGKRHGEGCVWVRWIIVWPMAACGV